MDIRSYILIGVMILIASYYFLSKKYSWKLKSDLFTIILVGLASVSLTTITYVKEDELKDRIRILETSDIRTYDCVGNGNSGHVAYTCQHYNIYYAGYFFNGNGETELNIKKEAPEELITYLDSSGIVYHEVGYSIVELELLMQKLVFDLSLNIDTTKMYGLMYDIENNSVELGTTEVAYYVSAYQDYVDLGMLKVVYQEPYETN